MAQTTRTDIFKKCYEFKEAEKARQEGWYPYFRPINENHGNTVIIEGKKFIMAGSNNYLGLSQDPRVIEAAKKAVERYGTSCSGSRFMNGTLALHEELEHRIARFVGKEAALCFTTGYQTNLGSISALMETNGHIVTDKLNHASIMDGIMLGSAFTRCRNIHRFKHNNMDDLREVLSRIPPDEPVLIVTDGVFSMEGDIAKLPEMKKIADEFGARIYLDEAHAMGVLGKTGRGTLEHYGDPNLADLVMCTFSKSFGSIGGFIAGDAEVIDYIQHHSRPLIFSASMPPAQIAAALAALDIIEKEPERVHRLQEIGRRMIQGFKDLGFDVGDTETPIVPLIIGDNEKTFKFWYTMYQEGLYTNPVISPAVPPNRALIRTSFMATHTDEELEATLEIAGRVGKAMGLI
ncbi:aminotransferase class I and II [Spirochaeta thermophila DSM 6578]|uniref:Aminotransferase class I and II n=1 Tax=Winmispira thermophila (strain ATCC 700085 / DSM 6578 / Z-1203) TaxID=869211 RepID=G0GEZ8_WINT7|nr:aminotransferase class I/II-fold pyridoxal phosphate-dependent enzyme [Spirochaeta thermophila]AEJ62342.1 aminotransferase class I and II [Spirochaeta thermophila DSM 6578]